MNFSSTNDGPRAWCKINSPYIDLLTTYITTFHSAERGVSHNVRKWVAEIELIETFEELLGEEADIIPLLETVMNMVIDLKINSTKNECKYEVDESRLHLEFPNNGTTTILPYKFRNPRDAIRLGGKIESIYLKAVNAQKSVLEIERTEKKQRISRALNPVRNNQGNGEEKGFAT